MVAREQDTNEPALNRSRVPPTCIESLSRVRWRSDTKSMPGHRHLLSSLPRQCTRFKVLRSFSSKPFARTEGESDEQSEDDWSAPKDPTLAVWKETIGKQFEKPKRPCNWLGGKVVEFVSVCVPELNQ